MTEKEQDPRKSGGREHGKKRRGYDSPPLPRSVPSGKPDVNQQEERPKKGREEESPGSE